MTEILTGQHTANMKERINGLRSANDVLMHSWGVVNAK